MTGNPQGNPTNGRKYPGLRDIAEGPTFVIVDGKDSDSGALDTLAQVHQLYAKEGSRMEESHIRRVAEEDRLREHYLANPPKPRDVVNNYWRGRRPDAANPGGEVEP